MPLDQVATQPGRGLPACDQAHPFADDMVAFSEHVAKMGATDCEVKQRQQFASEADKKSLSAGSSQAAGGAQLFGSMAEVAIRDTYI